MILMIASIALASTPDTSPPSANPFVRPGIVELDVQVGVRAYRPWFRGSGPSVRVGLGFRRGVLPDWLRMGVHSAFATGRFSGYNRLGPRVVVRNRHLTQSIQASIGTFGTEAPKFRPEFVLGLDGSAEFVTIASEDLELEQRTPTWVLGPGMSGAVGGILRAGSYDFTVHVGASVGVPLEGAPDVSLFTLFGVRTRLRRPGWARSP